MRQLLQGATFSFRYKHKYKQEGQETNTSVQEEYPWYVKSTWNINAELRVVHLFLVSERHSNQ